MFQISMFYLFLTVLRIVQWMSWWLWVCNTIRSQKLLINFVPQVVILLIFLSCLMVRLWLLLENGSRVSECVVFAWLLQLIFGICFLFFFICYFCPVIFEVVLYVEVEHSSWFLSGTPSNTFILCWNFLGSKKEETHTCVVGNTSSW